MDKPGDQCDKCGQALGEWFRTPCCDKDIFISTKQLDGSRGFMGGPAFHCPECNNSLELIDHGCDGFDLSDT